MTATVLTCAQVAEEVHYTPKRVRELVASGRFPQPIDPALSKRMWRWSSLAVEAYKEGNWTPPRADGVRRVS